jgi:predicted anti-sigma-YlaC factor YlaD
VSVCNLNECSPIRTLSREWSVCCLPLLLTILTFLSISCSLKKKAVDTLAEVLGKAESVYLSDEDPELVGEAMPFNLKTIETLLESSPEHRGLLLTATKSFVFYTYGFVEPSAFLLEDTDLERAREVRARAAKLHTRAYQFGLRGLEVNHPGFSSLLPRQPELACGQLKLDDVPFAVWTAAALGSAIGASKEDAESTADIALVGALLNRALQLDEGFEQGAVHEFLMSYESQRLGGSIAEARAHFLRARELSQGKKCGLLVSWTENISVQQQNRTEFEQLLQEALAFDVDSAPEYRLLNLLSQRRAKWLLGRVRFLFLEEASGPSEGVTP